MPVSIIRAETADHLAAVKKLLEEYGELRNHDVALGDFQKELNELPGEFSPPQGCLLLAELNEKPAGIVASRPLTDKKCEMKRLFVPDRFSGHQIGRALIKAVINEAKESGYEEMYLDTHPWMDTAEYLYKNAGFSKIAPYNNNPTPGIKHFMKAL